MSIKRFNGAGIYSSKSIKVWDQTTTQNDYVAIASAANTYGAIFTNIPTNYQHLQIRATSRDSSASSGQEMVIRLNGDTGSNYTFYQLIGNGSTASSYSYTRNYFECCFIPSAYHSAGIFGSAVIDILDWQSTTKVKTLKSKGGFDANGSGYSQLNHGMWAGSASTPITQIEIFSGSGTAVTGNSFALYGIKVAS
jgi:hypothetical protein